MESVIKTSVFPTKDIQYSEDIFREVIWSDERSDLYALGIVYCNMETETNHIQAHQSECDPIRFCELSYEVSNSKSPTSPKKQKIKNKRNSSSFCQLVTTMSGKWFGGKGETTRRTSFPVNYS